MSQASEATAADLVAILDPANSIYLLIDPLLGEPLPVDDGLASASALQAAREAAWMRPVTPVPLDSKIALSASMHPYLVALDGPEDMWLGVSLELAQGERETAQSDGVAGLGTSAHAIGGWLQCGQPTPKLAQQLAQWARVHPLLPTQARYQRIADRRAMDWLRHIAGDAALASRFGPVARWVYLDTRGQLAALHRSDGEAQTLPLPLEPAQWRRFMKGRALHTTLARWLGQLRIDGLPMPEGNSAWCYQRAESALAQTAEVAARWPARFKQSEDHSAWAALLLLHPTLPRHPGIQHLLDSPDTPGAQPAGMHTLCFMLLTEFRKSPL